ncbi:MAG: zinc ribbon domain-containing protein, partial [Chloroflexi bacterium]|nr:zinc ribbon domain-containing protein [Chloroflexota bacterium]
MKCSICNAENPSDAKNCHQCGFSFSLTQPTWPDFPTVEIPEPVAAPIWPDLLEAQVPTTPSEPIWPETDAAANIESVKIESVLDVVEDKKEFVSEPLQLSDQSSDDQQPSWLQPIRPLYPQPLDQPSDDDHMARSHIARGFEAIRKGLDEQAMWEFEQARDLADSSDIVDMAQAQLSELYHPSVEVVEEQAPPRQVPPRVVRPIPARKPTPPPTPIPIQLKDTDWDTLVRIGLVMGLVNGLLTGCGAVLCLGLVFSPVVGFVSGWMAARKQSTAHKDDQLKNVSPAVIVGGITGLGGWLGGIIGHPIWVASTSDSAVEPA